MDHSNVTVKNLESGEKVALAALEVTAVPRASVVGNGTKTDEEIVSQYQAEFAGLLGEIHQIYRAISLTDGFSKDISVELLWKTNAVENQPFRANIRLFLIVRAIDAAEQQAMATVQRLINLCHATLSLQRYGSHSVSEAVLTEEVSRISDQSIQALVKEEKAEALQNQLLPYCYAFDRIPAADHDLSKLVNVLTDHPDCAVSMQLMPTVFNENEAAEIDHTTQILQTLSRGVFDQGVGNVSFALAEKHAVNYRYYSENKLTPLFVFNILIYGDASAASDIANQVYGQLATGTEASAGLKLVSLDRREVNKDMNFYPLPWAVSEVLQKKERNAQIWSSGRFPGALYRLPYIVTGEEASEFFRLPVGSDRVSAGLSIDGSSKTGKTYADHLINAGDITVGKLRASSKGDTIGFSLRDLAKHMLVVGTPGSGKTTFSVSLLDRLWKEHHIPFLVIEPAKNEYRALKQSIPELQVFTPGKNFISPFVFNPFVPPKNVKLETYKSTLKTAFAAAVAMSTPLDKIFEESINNCYSDFRWLDTYTSDDKGTVFNISDFIKCFQNTFDDIGYTGDAQNIGRAGTVRLKSLVNLFDHYFSIPIEDILQNPTVIELAAIENSDEKALIIALLLLSILAYVNANYVGEGGLKNVILLEEAHVLLDADTDPGIGEADPSAIAQRLLKRMLAEIRSYGVGLIIADQSPRKVTTDVVALTDMKVVFRLVEAEDKRIIGDSTNMSDAQVQRMARLKPGEAFLFFHRLEEPEEVVISDYRMENNISITLSDEGIRSLSTYWDNRADKLRPYPQCQLVPHCAHSCDYNRRILAREIARRIFVKHFKSNSTDLKLVENVFGQISKLIQAELDDEPFTHELFSCIKVHLWRKIRYDSKIPVRDIQIENSLKK